MTIKEKRKQERVALRKELRKQISVNETGGPWGNDTCFQHQVIETQAVVMRTLLHLLKEPK